MVTKCHTYLNLKLKATGFSTYDLSLPPGIKGLKQTFLLRGTKGLNEPRPINFSECAKSQR